MTDQSRVYVNVGSEFQQHSTVNHSEGEYARGIVTTNTVEGYFGVMKRGINGIYQHVSEYHLRRYLAEYDFRYSNRIALGVNDMDRTDRMVAGIVGKRLTYQTTRRQLGAAV
jgi:hypothetical protein